MFRVYFVFPLALLGSYSFSTTAAQTPVHISEPLYTHSDAIPQRRSEYSANNTPHQIIGEQLRGKVYEGSKRNEVEDDYDAADLQDNRLRLMLHPKKSITLNETHLQTWKTDPYPSRTQQNAAEYRGLGTSRTASMMVSAESNSNKDLEEKVKNIVLLLKNKNETGLQMLHELISPTNNSVNGEGSTVGSGNVADMISQIMQLIPLIDNNTLIAKEISKVFKNTKQTLTGLVNQFSKTNETLLEQGTNSMTLDSKFAINSSDWNLNNTSPVKDKEAQNTTQNIYHNATQNANQNTMENTLQNSTQNVMQSTMQNTMQDSTQNAVQNSTDNNTESIAPVIETNNQTPQTPQNNDSYLIYNNNTSDDGIKSVAFYGSYEDNSTAVNEGSDNNGENSLVTNLPESQTNNDNKISSMSCTQTTTSDIELQLQNILHLLRNITLSSSNIESNEGNILKQLKKQEKELNELKEQSDYIFQQVKGNNVKMNQTSLI